MAIELEFTYISPEGNPEIWVKNTQPEGYVTEEEWYRASR